ncbi:MAG: glycosyltransferase family 4 protein [Chloroflexi bacterium]|nr:glycosyltransferase family 4 protein [Chloroflexota bacterium]
MKIYLANIHQWHVPEGVSRLIMEQGHQLAGNWREVRNRDWGLGRRAARRALQSLEQFDPDLIVYSPHRHETAITLGLDMVKQVPTILWALCPDYLTGWDRERNEHEGGFLDSVREMLPYFHVNLANSVFTKELLESRVPGYTFEVCYLGIDTKGIDEAAARKRRGERATTVLWQHRWTTDKNLPEALDIVRRLARRHPSTTFYLGRKEEWDEPFWAPQSLKDYYFSVSDELNSLSNIRYSLPFETQREYWEFIAGADIAFSCAYHDTFGIGMLEQAYAGAACIVPNRVVYPEVHSGALVMPPSEVEAGIESLLEDPALWARVGTASRDNAAKYNLACTAERLLSFFT